MSFIDSLSGIVRPSFVTYLYFICSFLKDDFYMNVAVYGDVSVDYTFSVEASSVDMCIFY